VGFRALVNISRVSGTSLADSHVTWFEYISAIEADSVANRFLMILI